MALGTFSGSGVAALLKAQLSPEAMQSFGWRICFWLGLLVGLVGLFLRRQAIRQAILASYAQVSEPEEFQHARELGDTVQQPLKAFVFKER